MDKEKLFKSYLPMTETAFYILISLKEPRHGYGIAKFVSELTRDRLKLGSGTIYGTLTKMQRDGIISVYDDSAKRIIYEITEPGKELLRAEMKRIKQVCEDMRTMEDFLRRTKAYEKIHTAMSFSDDVIMNIVLFIWL